MKYFLILITLLSHFALFSALNKEQETSKHSTKQHHHQSATPHCSPEEVAFQLDNLDLASPHICDVYSMSPWKLVQMIYPNIRTFLDVGANRGYTAAEFFGLWSPGHGFDRRSLFNALTEAGNADLLLNKDNLNTYCNDALQGVEFNDQPLLCPGRYANYGMKLSKCLYRRSITIYSFDGQKTHVEDQKQIYKFFPHIHPNYTENSKLTSVKATWDYTHAAVTDSIPPGVSHGYFKVDTRETGKLIKGIDDTNADKNTMKVVPLMTVDKFCEDKKLNNVPVLKIDAEGGDIDVLKGATNTLLHRGVKVINFECFNCMSKQSEENFNVLNVNFGFTCYMAGKNNLFVKVTKCWNFDMAIKNGSKCTKESNPRCPEFNQWSKPPNRMDGNAFCFHRSRASALLHVVDNMSLHKWYDSESRGHFAKDGLLANFAATFDESGGIAQVPDSARGAYERYHGRNWQSGEKEY